MNSNELISVLRMAESQDLALWSCWELVIEAAARCFMVFPLLPTAQDEDFHWAIIVLRLAIVLAAFRYVTLCEGFCVLAAARSAAWGLSAMAMACRSKAA